MADYSKITSKVQITFVDGEVKDYFIDASPSIANYLAREAGDSGFVTLRNGSSKNWAIPVSQIRDMEISAFDVTQKDSSK